jgi:MFS family permease
MKFLKITDLGLFWLMIFSRSFLILNSVLTIFFEIRGFSSEFAFVFLAVANVFILLLEYPTGVIGDWFGHKYSIILGNIFNALAVVITYFADTASLLYLAVFVLSIGQTLNSGSDTALLKTLSKDFTKDHARYKIILLGAIAIAGVVGPVLLTISEILPFLIQFIFLIIAIVCGLIIRGDTKSEITENNPFNLIKESFSHVLKTPKVALLMTNIAVSKAFTNCLKYVMTIYFLFYAIPEGVVGFLYSSILILNILGTSLQPRLEKHIIKTFVVFGVSASLSLFFINNLSAHLVFLFVSVIMLSIFSTYFSKHFLDGLPIKNHASISSLESLVTRGTVTILTFSIVLVGESMVNLQMFYGIIFLVITILGIYYLTSKQIKSQT